MLTLSLTDNIIFNGENIHVTNIKNNEYAQCEKLKFVEQRI